MTTGTLILLTDKMFESAVLGALGDSAANLAVIQAETSVELSQAVERAAAPPRLLAFCTGVIVTPDVIQACEAGAYNVHPGPPEYPGLFPSVFAIYEKAASFGTTIHRMTKTVDGGEIIYSDSYPISGSIDRAGLDKLAFENALKVTTECRDMLCDLSKEPAASGEVWSGSARTRKDFETLCALPDGVDAKEFELRYRAIGEGPDHALSITLFGHRFKLDNQRTDDVSRGGQSLA